jgi:hypothetical protein
MAEIVARLQSERVERVIDRGVFALGAASLALALLLTIAGAVGGTRTVAEAAPMIRAI